MVRYTTKQRKHKEMDDNQNRRQQNRNITRWKYERKMFADKVEYEVPKKIINNKFRIFWVEIVVFLIMQSNSQK